MHTHVTWKCACAQVFFKRALDVEPNDPDTLCNYALLMTNVRRDHTRAADMFQLALKGNPWHVRTLCGLGMLQQNVAHNYTAARSLYSRALQSNANHVPSLINLAVLYRDKLNEARAAESLVQHALSLEPDNPWLKANAESFNVGEGGAASRLAPSPHASTASV